MSPQPARWRRSLLAIGAALAVLAAVAVALAHAIPLPERLSMADSTVLRWRDGTVAHATLAPDERWRIAVTVDQVDPAYIDALVALEDERFWIHPGVDPVAILRAAGTNLVRGRVVSGASTITMQVVRLAEPRPRTLTSKGIEALRAVQLELLLSKTEILEAYLRLTPYGGNLEGIEAASHAYFGHGAQHLSPAEIATLLAVPQSPTRRAPSPQNAERLRAARDEIAARLLDQGLLERHLAAAAGDGAVTVQQVHARITETPVPTARTPLPRDAAHAAAWMLGRRRDGRDVQSTLDHGIQQLAQRALSDGAAARAAQGIDHGAVVVVEHHTGQVVALVGGPDFGDDRDGAQIPAFAVPRSPGSTLKPFLYARAIDLGMLLPETLVLDVPVRYGGYSPENYDGDFVGMVRMETALSRSLNVPFVRLLEQVGVEPFLGDLRSLGAFSLHPTPGHYGLSLVVGGVELSPLELATLYAGLAEGGQAVALRTRLDQPPPAPGPQVLSAEAAWLTSRTLVRRDRPDFPRRGELARLPRQVQWKTGTSFGNRDAWAIGSGERYTVAVWLGNLDQRPSAWLVGADAAGPVLFDVLEGLGDGREGEPFRPGAAPRGLVPVELCGLSGKLPTDACPHRTTAMALERAVPTGRCDLHVALQLDAQSGLRVGPLCREDRDVLDEVRVQWPTEVRRWLGSSMAALPQAPDWDPACAAPATGDGPRILAPGRGQIAVLVPGVAASDQELPLEAAASAGSGPLTWFVAGREVGRAPPDEPVWWTPTVGRHEVVVVDAHGRSDRSIVQVQAASPGLAGG
ncbi:MAG: penicillin-binding protein 1C [Alphaproteobacteria bacterium]|nr:penicillin-binding protein 1C [Alphaproteobacteria bacterium]